MALLLQEPETEALLDLAARAERVQLSAATRLELTLVAEGSQFNSTSSEIEALLSNLRVEVVPFDANPLDWPRPWMLRCCSKARISNTPM